MPLCPPGRVRALAAHRAFNHGSKIAARADSEGSGRFVLSSMKIKPVKIDPVKILPVPLEGNFVRLEPLEEVRHLPGLCAIGLDPDLWRWVPYQVTTPEEMREYIRQALAAETAGTALPFAKIEKASGRVAGSARYM